MELLDNPDIPEPKKTRCHAMPDKDIAYALVACDGLQYLAADMLKMTDSTVSSRIQESPFLQHVRDACLQRRLDRTEKKLMKLIEENESLGAICFFLKTRGKSRGYSESSLSNMSPEEFSMFQKTMSMLKAVQEERTIDINNNNVS